MQKRSWLRPGALSIVTSHSPQSCLASTRVEVSLVRWRGTRRAGGRAAEQQAMYNVQYTIDNMQYTVDSRQIQTAYTMHNTQYTVHNTPHNTQYTIQNTAQHTHYTHSREQREEHGPVTSGPYHFDLDRRIQDKSAHGNSGKR